MYFHCLIPKSVDVVPVVHERSIPVACKFGYECYWLLCSFIFYSCWATLYTASSNVYHNFNCSQTQTLYPKQTDFYYLVILVDAVVVNVHFILIFA